MYWRIRSQKTLALDVWEHASSAALEDYRFYPVRPEEVPQLHIEISRLTIPVALITIRRKSCSASPSQCGWSCLARGVAARNFLPQVWEKLPSPDVFLSHLCQK